MRSGVVVLGLGTALGALVGCGFSSHGAGNGSGDGVDAEPPGADACVSFATQVDTCRLTFDGDLMLSGTVTYDTTMHELHVNEAAMPVAHMILTTLAGNVDAIYAHNVRLTAGAGLRATGTLPFAIVASGSVTLDDGASIDVGNGGAGALTSCTNAPQAGGNNTGGAGGGGGGGYGADGGRGGDGNSDGTASQGGAKGTSIATPMGPRGGCPGAPGGTGDSPGGLGGLGGGALYIAAADRIELLGTSGTVLTAGGGGGHGGNLTGGGDAGGGGGGSGGMIFLESPHVLGSHGRIAANGGGGGEGSNSAQAGHDGDNGSTTTSRAAGGSGNAPDGTDGGHGGSGGTPTGEAVTTTDKGGGGGGGGGVGFIHVVSTDFQVETVSPATN